MSKAIRVTTKKKRRGRPKTTGKGAQIGMRWQKPALDAIDALRAAQEDEPERPEAIRRLVDRGLAAEGDAGKPKRSRR
jgi:hypothetical protein